MVNWTVVGGNQIPMLRHENGSRLWGERSAQRKPSKSGWDRVKVSPHTTFCNRGGRRDWCPLYQPDFPRSTAQGIIQMVTHPVIKPVQQGLTSANDRNRCFPLVTAMPYFDWVLIHAKCSTVTVDSTMWFSFIHARNAIPFFRYHIEWKSRCWACTGSRTPCVNKNSIK